jgi:hypothetical protein
LRGSTARKRRLAEIARRLGRVADEIERMQRKLQ